MRTALIELQYLPPIEYFSALSQFDEVLVEKHEYFEKQSYRNRCYVNSVHGREMLIVPLTAKHGKVKISDVKIDYSQKWLNNHWRTIQSAYGKAPFYEYFSDQLHDELFRKHELLYDLNRALLTLCLNWLKWYIPVRETGNYQKTTKEGIVDLRSAIHPKKGEVAQSFYQPAVYYQVFGSKFVQNLSLIDLIFCEGPGARAIVKASAKK